MIQTFQEPYNNQGFSLADVVQTAEDKTSS